MSALVIIPARYGASRFPGKPLALLGGKPLIQHVYENSLGSRLSAGAVVATDSGEILDAVASFGGRAVMTSPAHSTGTDRIAEVAAGMDYDIIVNVQGDEPLIRPEAIDSAIGLLDDERASIGTLARRVRKREEIIDPNIVKVAVDGEGFAVYFSRAPIPYDRDRWRDLQSIGDEGAGLYQHIGIYSYRREALLRLSGLEPTALERTERLEQLRALENGMRIKVGETSCEIIGVDTPEDLAKVWKCLSSSS
jgi:3-deoxy-manno-octulosonate cytidylyltransferase (CMP-KDO synthetase)